MILREIMKQNNGVSIISDFTGIKLSGYFRSHDNIDFTRYVIVE